MDKTVLARVVALPNMSISELKTLWRDVYEEEPPIGNKSQIIRRLAYRLQELAYGVDPQIENRIKQQANELFGSGKKNKSKRKVQYQQPIPGTKLVREYKGIEHQVTILEEGYEYAGCLYKSLSKVALVITGSSWSGPAFFGLNNKPQGGKH
ncbi:DUF2924 domain-containing protein [Bartonella queenslandensis]|uniref:DUF2924 domain-containing protein n=1 Tax=Bartonella queenslandensis TaxID=481138 RepID=UPI0002E984C8|nr:DUF2924 domain-containing protein [Bartonella queenslandensis]